MMSGGNRSLLICLNWLYVRSKFGDNSLDYQLKSEGFNKNISWCNLDGFVEDFGKCSMKLSIGERQAPS